MTIANTLAVPASPAERLAVLIDALCTAIAAHGARGFLTAALQVLLWSRLRRMAFRVRRLASRIEAGTPWPAPLRAPRRPAERRARPRPYLRLSHGFAWLVRAVPATASGASQLQFLLTDPAMADLADTPPMRRLLRPLCRLLGVRLPPTLKPAPPPEAAAPPPIPAAAEASRPGPEPPWSAPPPPDPPEKPAAPAKPFAV